jgi:hypothetical protein
MSTFRTYIVFVYVVIFGATHPPWQGHPPTPIHPPPHPDCNWCRSTFFSFCAFPQFLCKIDENFICGILKKKIKICKKICTFHSRIFKKLTTGLLLITVWLPTNPPTYPPTQPLTKPQTHPLTYPPGFAARAARTF